jgi:hypothetical protein
MKTFVLAIILATTAIAANVQGYPGPQGGQYVYAPDHEYHLLSRNHPVMTLRPYCNPQWNPDCNVLPPPGYPLQPLIPIAPPPHPVQQLALPPVAGPPPQAALTMQQSREAVIRAGEAHCKRFNDPEVCHEKK